MHITNFIRPKKGRLWVEELKDQDGTARVDSIISQVDQNQVMGHIRNFEDLKMALTLSDSYEMERQEFLSFYKALSQKEAKMILNPEIVYELMKSTVWKKVRFTMDDYQIGIFCLDGYQQILIENYLNLEIPKKEVVTLLDKNPKFRERIISAAQFQKAYDRLSLNLQRQIINDKYKLIQWGSDLVQVGIANQVEDGTVIIAFEIITDYGSKIETMVASEIAIGWLFKELKSQGINLPLPTRLEIAHD